MSGKLWRLQIPGQAVRGAYVNLGPAWAALVKARQYGPDAAQLLGQTLAAMPMLLMQLKSRAKLTLQISQAQPLSLLVAQGDTLGQVRGMIKLDGDALDTAALRGQLVVTLEPEGARQNYQGIVALEGAGLSQWLAQYFQQSEQLRTRLVLCADQERAAGFMLQALPGEDVDFDWVAAIEAMDVDLLPDAPGEWLSAMLGCDLQISESPSPVELACPCSATTVSNMLVGLGRVELESILEELGAVSVDCGFCGQNYRYDATDVERILSSESSAPELH